MILRILKVRHDPSQYPLQKFPEPLLFPFLFATIVIEPLFSSAPLNIFDFFMKFTDFSFSGSAPDLKLTTISQGFPNFHP